MGSRRCVPTIPRTPAKYCYSVLKPCVDVHLTDGTRELFRHYYALPSARESDGREVAAAWRHPFCSRTDPTWRYARCDGRIGEIYAMLQHAGISRKLVLVGHSI